MSAPRQDRFTVGDEVWWNVPVVMEHCRTWSPDITRPTTIIAVKNRGLYNCGHSQLVRVSPNYCPYGDEFDGTWLLPTGITTHNDPVYREMLAKAREPETHRGWTISRGRFPEPAWMATGPNYDASYEGEEDGFVDNGEKADAPTRETLITEIDAWITEHCETCGGHGLVTYAIDDCGPCPDCSVRKGLDDDA